jgi:hypothetical protein
VKRKTPTNTNATVINFSSFWSSLFCYFQFDFRISISTASPHRKNKLSMCVYNY